MELQQATEIALHPNEFNQIAGSCNARRAAAAMCSIRHAMNPHTQPHASTYTCKAKAFARSKGALLTKFPNTFQRVTTQSMTTSRTAATQATTSDIPMNFINHSS